jgi:hypothetical protein
MTRKPRRKPDWELFVRGKQREPIEADLLAQIVVMLGRQFSQETTADEAADDGSENNSDVGAVS